MDGVFGERWTSMPLPAVRYEQAPRDGTSAGCVGLFCGQCDVCVSFFQKKSLTQILNLDFSQMMHLISIPFDL